MTDTRRRPQSPAPQPDGFPDAEDAPTSVISRITEGLDPAIAVERPQASAEVPGEVGRPASATSSGQHPTTQRFDFFSTPRAHAAPEWSGPAGDATSAHWDPRSSAPPYGSGGGQIPAHAGTINRAVTSGWAAGDTHVQPLPARTEAPAHAPDQAEFVRSERREPPVGTEELERATESARPKRKRDPHLDNVKFLGVALVPLGHALVPTLAADSARATYLYIYVFHMPLMVLVSGYLSKNFWNSNAKTNKLVDTFLVPYVIVEIGYAALRFALGHKWSLTVTDPAWLNWYLIALLFWRLSTPVWKRMRYPIVAAVLVYLFAGFSELTGDFSMDRFFGLLPFFVIGLVLTPEFFDFLQRRWVRVLSVLVLLGSAAVAIFLVKNYSIKLSPIYYKNSYKDLNLNWWQGMALRSALLVAALAMSAAVMSLVPRRETWFTDLGTRTLYCYLLHGIPVMIAKEMGWVSVPWLYGPLGVGAIASASFALAIVLCLPLTRTAFRWLLEPRLTWLYRRPRTHRAT